MSIDYHTAPARPNRLPPSARYGRPREVPHDFADIVADHRSVGRTDDDIALSFGLTVESLHRRFYRAAGFNVDSSGVVTHGIPVGRRWRDIEDAASGDTLNKYEAARVAAPSRTSGRLPGQRRSA